MVGFDFRNSKLVGPREPAVGVVGVLLDVFRQAVRVFGPLRHTEVAEAVIPLVTVLLYPEVAPAEGEEAAALVVLDGVVLVVEGQMLRLARHREDKGVVVIVELRLGVGGRRPGLRGVAAEHLAVGGALHKKDQGTLPVQARVERGQSEAVLRPPVQQFKVNILLSHEPAVDKGEVHVDLHDGTRLAEAEVLIKREVRQWDRLN